MTQNRAGWLLTALGIVAQMLYPATGGTARSLCTVTIVVALAGAGIAGALSTSGRAALPALIGLAAAAWLAEWIGVHTGWPFGEYGYASSGPGSLGPMIGGVPLLVPGAWVMMALPALVLARAVTTRPLARVGITALTMTAWDVYLDPQLVAAGHWTWAHPLPSLPGIDTVPLTNLGGWLLVSAVLAAGLNRWLPESVGSRTSGPEAAALNSALWPSLIVLGWTWWGSALANLVLFDRPAVALWGWLWMSGAALAAGAAYRATHSVRAT